MASLAEALVGAIGADAVLTDSEDLAHYGSDRCRGDWPVAPAVVVLPRSIDEVQAVVRCCAARGAAIVPSGGRTGLAGAATASAGEVVVSLERMHRVLEVDPIARTLRCEAGATVEAVQRAAAEERLIYPVDFAAKGTAQVGGSISTNAGGVRVVRYGGTRQWVAGLSVVLASGEVLRVGGPLVKDNTGYDLRHVFIGAEGTLGIIVEAVLRLTDPPRASIVALAAVPDETRAVELFGRVQSSVVLQAFECFDQASLRSVLTHRGRTDRGPFDPPSPQHALIDVEVIAWGDEAEAQTTEALMEILAQAQEDGLITDAVVASTPAQARDLWALREDVSESLHRERPHKADVALAVSEIAPFADRWRAELRRILPEAQAVIFGHIGDGNLHLNVVAGAMSADDFDRRRRDLDAMTYALVHEYCGSISAEHGIGLLKRDHLHHSRSELEIATMRAIKNALDPGGLFNPGKIF